MTYLRFIFTVTALLAATSSWGADDLGLYLGVGYGLADVDYEINREAGGAQGLDPSDSLRDGDDFYNFEIGYRVLNHVSIELSHMESETFEEQISIDPLVTIIDTTNNIASLEASITSFSVVIDYRAYEALSLIGRLGYSLADIESTLSGDFFGRPVTAHESENGVTYGFGLAYDLTNDFSVRLLWNRYEAGPLDLETTGLTAVYSF